MAVFAFMGIGTSRCANNNCKLLILNDKFSMKESLTYISKLFKLYK